MERIANNMKKIVYVFFLLPYFTHAQEFLTGKLSDEKQQGSIYYDRTQINLTKQVFQTLYKVFDTDLNPVCTITITHDRHKQYLFVATKPQAGAQENLAVKYDRDKSGLVFCDINNLDTVFTQLGRYSYLLSFADSTLDYAILHQLKFSGNKTLALDPLNKVRLKKHVEQVVKLFRKYPTLARQQTKALPMSAEEREDYSLQNVITKMRSLAHKQETQLRDSVAEFQQMLTQKVKAAFGTEAVSITTKKFAGEKKNGRLYGQGIMVEEGNVYYGTFEKGIFLRGVVCKKVGVNTYCGYMVDGHYNGLGLLQLANGNYQIGYFTDDKFINGFTQATETNGDVYKGRMIGAIRKGYGELMRANGTIYVGDFSNVTFVRGFAKEVDPFGYVLYSKLESGEKIGITPQEGEMGIGKDAVAGKN